MNERLSGSTRDQHAALTRSAGFHELLDRTHLELRGNDRATLLHNLCTNDIRRLQPGQGCEAFVLNVQGKIVGHVYVFCGPDSLLLDAPPGQASRLLAHLDRYIIREDVQLLDRSAEWTELLLSGPDSADLLRRLGAAQLPTELLGHQALELAGAAVWLRRVDWTSPVAWCLVCQRTDREKVGQLLAAAGAVSCQAEAVEAARVERGTPVFGPDISDQNLPQEVNRDARAISFTKGCYLGQETVARIDALGHVNWLLTGVVGEPLADAQDELLVDGKPSVRLATRVYSPQSDGPLALAYVRRGLERPGTRIPLSNGTVSVVALPLDIAQNSQHPN
ncbi:MAG: folate-binding protein YgfZ [Pirellulaceae bacterium]|nr:folate-binding protein YgfZ [Pirellulaceae bacterium]